MDTQTINNAIMIDYSDFGSGPFDGGCLTCAKAIVHAAGEGELIRIVKIKNERTQHYGVMIKGVVFDFDGLHITPQEWIKTFCTNEAINPKEMAIAHGYDQESSIPNDPKTQNKITKLLHEAI